MDSGQFSSSNLANKNISYQKFISHRIKIGTNRASAITVSHAKLPVVQSDEIPTAESALHTPARSNEQRFNEKFILASLFLAFFLFREK
jgi:hypothetical protein